MQQQAQVVAGESVSVDFELTESAISLEEVITIESGLGPAAVTTSNPNDLPGQPDSLGRQLENKQDSSKIKTGEVVMLSDGSQEDRGHMQLLQITLKEAIKSHKSKFGQWPPKKILKSCSTCLKEFG